MPVQSSKSKRFVKAFFTIEADIWENFKKSTQTGHRSRLIANMVRKFNRSQGKLALLERAREVRAQQTKRMKKGDIVGIIREMRDSRS